jgi:UDP-N-acetylmuramyl pentapeptide phosphotransferase/UDP-N-acetylglucosamine-1-phosphate transferase
VLVTVAVWRQDMALAGGVALAAGGLGLLGLFDDARGLRYLPRLLVQLTITAVGAFMLLRETAQPLFWVPLSALWVTSYVNAYNFMDGANGVAATQAITAGATWWLIGMSQDLPAFALLGLMIATAALGFLPHNFPRARVFLGDTGSYFFGGWLGALAVLGVALGLTPEAVVAPLAVYFADTGSTLIRRVRQRKPWYSAHREHVYQGLILHGWSHARVSVTLLALTVLTSALGWLALQGALVTRVLADAAIGIVAAAYVVLGRRYSATKPEFRGPAA